MVASLSSEGEMFGIGSHRLSGGIGHDRSVVFGDWDAVHGRDDEGE